MKTVSGLLVGLLFGLGLAASGMTDTNKVIGFLDIFGDWNSDLLFVMGSAVVISFIGFKWVFTRKVPVFSEQFFLPVNKAIDYPLVMGAGLFGTGWGLYGYCPGSAIGALAYLSPVTVVFVLCMLIGMALMNVLSKRLSK